MSKLVPFSNTSIRVKFETTLNAALAEIANLTIDYVLNTSPTELEEFYLGRVYIEPLTLQDRAQSDRS